MPDQQAQPKGKKKISTGWLIGGVVALGLGVWWYTRQQSSSGSAAGTAAAATPGDGTVSGIPAAAGLGDNGQDLDEILRDLNGHPRKPPRRPAPRAGKGLPKNRPPINRQRQVIRRRRKATS